MRRSILQTTVASLLILALAGLMGCEPAKAPETKPATPAPAVKAEPVKAPETKAAPDKTATPAAPEKK